MSDKRLRLDLLPDHFECDIDSGEIRRKLMPRSEFSTERGYKIHKSKYAGSIATRITPFGYLRVNYKGRDIMAHKIVWFFAYGVWPEFEIDHINHNRSDNRIENLRKSSYKENNKNKSKYKNNTSGTTGVVWHKKKKRWIATIFTDGKRTEIGSFVDKQEAIKARKRKQKELGFHKNHGA